MKVSIGIFVALLVALLVTVLGLTINKRYIFILALLIILFSGGLFLYNIIFPNDNDSMVLSVTAFCIYVGANIGVVLMTVIPINNKSINK